MASDSNNNSKSNSRFISQVCSNTKSDLIEITEDKLENILIKFLSNYTNLTIWLTPLGIFLSLLLTFLTAADFKEFLGITKNYWYAFFVLSLILSAFFTIYYLFKSLLNYKKTKLEFLINKIKNN
ncbi:hypothetical protein [Flavobacterium sp.]|uniref:hypothetical protein n=1 Tax=Flavobacterium sp. TaxID=239 RepID=UPI00286FAC0C|nr:hypothetical protein [Flavobacterium sp.]